MVWYNRLRDYVGSHGTARVPNRHQKTREQFPLGVWVTIQRRLRRRGQLSPEKVKALELLPGWAWDPVPVCDIAPMWKAAYGRLRKYADSQGTSRVHRDYKTPDGFGLGIWVCRERRLHRRGKLAPWMVQELEALPGWEWEALHNGRLTKQHEAVWMRQYDCLGEYAGRTGTSRVTSTYVTPDGFRLGLWVRSQRMAYRRGKIGLGRVRALEKLPGWTWRAGRQVSSAVSWKRGLAHLEAFIRKRGTSLVPALYEDRDGYRLGTWVANQRVLFRSGRLTIDKISALQALPGWLWYPSQRWRTGV